MSGEEKKKSLQVEAYDLYETIRPQVEEFLDEWFIVGMRPGCGSRVLIGSRHNGWNKLQPAYDAVQKWKRENPLGG
jgi:hypothetical protein|tara:strand:- start:1931 stop:2158 length:228 start_codon:yes stop_codon:yes gene_type:complete